MFDNEELPETFLPVTPVYRVLSADASTLRIVEAHDQKVKIGVTDLGCDLVELAMMHHREIDVEVDPGKWIRVRPDGSMMPAPPAGEPGLLCEAQTASCPARAPGGAARGPEGLVEHEGAAPAGFWRRGVAGASPPAR